jgi:hypothetical protein
MQNVQNFIKDIATPNIDTNAFEKINKKAIIS